MSLLDFIVVLLEPGLGGWIGVVGCYGGIVVVLLDWVWVVGLVIGVVLGLGVFGTGLWRPFLVWRGLAVLVTWSWWLDRV